MIGGIGVQGLRAGDRHKSKARGNADTDCGELIRFNESVDQAIIESLACHTVSLERMREMFIGILAHDLRTPLGLGLSIAREIVLAHGRTISVDSSDITRFVVMLPRAFLSPND